MRYKKTILVGFTLFGLVVLTALSTFYVSLGKCPSDSLSCDDGAKCVPQKLVCDFVRDCEDGKDESRHMCANFYGSQEVINADSRRGEKILQEYKLMFNVTTSRELNEICILDKSELTDGCYCMRVNLVVCYNFTALPESFPRDVSLIELRNNSLTLKHNDTFENYGNLTYLNLSHNNISFVPSRLLSKLQSLRKLFLQNNMIGELPEEMFCDLDSLVWLIADHNQLRDFDLEIFGPLQSLQWLNLSNNNLTLNDTKFPDQLEKLNELALDFNSIQLLNADLFENLNNLTFISLRSNGIEVIKATTFNHLHRLQELRLSDNPIHHFDSGFLLRLPELNALYLDNLRIEMNEDFISKLNVSFLSIGGIHYTEINFKALAKVEKLNYVVFKSFNYCSMEQELKVNFCRPSTDGISSNEYLLSNPTLRYAAWLMALLTCFGNGMVLWGRFKFHDENKSVSMVIRNLAVSDLIMSFYLAIISYQDFQYHGHYHTIASKWVQSWGCILAGVLSMVSSEVTILILTFMSIERFLLISDPFGHHRLNTKNVMMSLYTIWLVGVSIAIFPVILFRSSTKFYGIHNGGTCFPLFIQEKYPLGWEYSAFVFLGINLTLLLLIATLYTALLFSIWRTRRATTLDFFDCEFAIRFFFIVLTDTTCWAPIIILKFLAFTDFEVSGDAYAWLVVFVLPLNSAVNPLLFTFSTPKYRDQIYTAFSKQSFSKKHDSTSQQATADESQVKLHKSSSSSNSSTSSKLMFLRKKS